MISVVDKVFTPSVTPPVQKHSPAWWFVFRAQKMLVLTEKPVPEIPLLVTLGESGLHPLHERYIGTLDGTHCYTAYLTETTEPPANMDFQGLRRLFGYLDEPFYAIAVRALGIINWDATHTFCSQCGSKTEKRSDILARQCPKCAFTMFPRISPAVIVLVEKGKKVLLARASRFTEELYSVIAGFVEPGETLEETVTREIKEETGIDVKNIRYFGSQPWPFPDSLMIAFTAQYAGGKIKVDGEELLDAGWFDADQLPNIPGKISIARSLIDWFVAKHGAKGSIRNKTGNRRSSERATRR
jgi:NAD+ diphosphatase